MADRKPAGAHAVLMGRSSRAVLRSGYAAVIVILAFSTIQAYRIQGFVSEQHLDIYRQFVKQEEAISRLRRSIWLAGNYVRDFFLNTNPDRSELLNAQYLDLEAGSQKALNQLDRLSPDEAATRAFKANLREYWNTIAPISESMAMISGPAAYRFIQQEIVPRRTALYDALQQTTERDQEALQKSEFRFLEMRQDSIRTLVFTLVLCVVLCILVARFSLQHADRLENETARQHSEVAQAKRELEQLSARLLEIEEEGRKRLSRELHDEIGQTLALLQIEVSQAVALINESQTQTRMREHLDRARGLAEGIAQNVRNISLLLRPALLDDLGLVPALQWLLEDFQRRSGVSCEFHEVDVHDMLPDSVKTCVYRIIQEALHNCEKHSGASQIRVVLQQSANALLIHVEDNGRGFELNAKGMPQRNAGLGILGMRERAARVGGTLALRSSPGLGTQFYLDIPLAELASDNDRVTAVETGLNANAYSNPVGR